MRCAGDAATVPDEIKPDSKMNYRQSLQMHTEMVIKGNSSEIGSSMLVLETS